MREITYPLSAFTKATPPAADAAGTARADAPAPNTEIVRIASLDELAPYNVPPRVLVIIAQGHHPDQPKAGDNSRSKWLLDAVCQLMRAGVPEAVIRGIITDPGWGISASVLDKGSGQDRYLDRQIARAKEVASGDPAAITLHEMNDLHAVIDNYGNNTRVMTEGPPRPFFQKFGDFNNRYMNKFVQVGTDKDNKPIWMPRGKWWLLHARRRQYQRVEFVPGGDLPESIYNLWRGFAAKAVEGSCSLFLALLLDTICTGDETHSEWLLNWMAHAVQHPQEPGEVAVVLRGGQGIGKSFFAEHFGELFGRHFVPVTDPKHVIGNFNNMLHDALLVFSDEAFAANDKRAEGILKGLVTQSHITIEPKGVDAFKARKFFRMLLASNNSWVVPADTDDRRFFVLDVGIAHKYDTAYFAAIDVEWKSGGREALMHLLLNRDITGFDHRHRPETAALVDQKLHSLRGARRVIYEMLASGDPPVAKADKERVFIATRDLHRDTQAKCSETALGRELGIIADNKRGDRVLCGDERRKGFWLPRLSEARRRWAEATKLKKVPWPRDDGEWTHSTDAGGSNVAIGDGDEPSGKGEKPPF